MSLSDHYLNSKLTENEENMKTAMSL